MPLENPLNALPPPVMLNNLRGPEIPPGGGEFSVCVNTQAGIQNLAHQTFILDAHEKIVLLIRLLIAQQTREVPMNNVNEYFQRARPPSLFAELCWQAPRRQNVCNRLSGLFSFNPGYSFILKHRAGFRLATPSYISWAHTL